MATAKKSKKWSALNFSQTTVLAHVEHVKSIAEAFAKAGETYKAKHEASDKEDTWIEDLPRNLFEASIDLHEAIFESPKRVFDIYRASAKSEK